MSVRTSMRSGSPLSCSGAAYANVPRNSTAAGEFLGTFAYAAPEQLKGDPDLIDVRTDIFALGVIFYEILAGERPWQLQGRVSIADLLIARLEEAPEPPSSLRSSSRPPPK